MMNCNLLLMASLSTMWTVVVGLLAVVTLVSIVLFLLKSREVTTLSSPATRRCCYARAAYGRSERP